MTKPLIIGIAGGSGSGKTTIAKKIQELCGSGVAQLFQLDHYYRDLAHLTASERDQVNFDHPNQLELDLVSTHLGELAKGRTIDRPTYEFASHTRSSQVVKIAPTDVILVDGIFTLYHLGIRSHLSYGLFVDVGDDIRFIRRMQRDMSERGRSMDSIVKQYLSTVKPMHDQFVAPSKIYADLVIDWNQFNERTLKLTSQMILALKDQK